MNKKVIFAALTVASIGATACKKDKKEPVTTTAEVSHQDVINAVASNVTAATYVQLARNSSDLYDAILAFNATPSQAGLESLKLLWKNARSTWEQSEGFIYGPVATENIDPRIDTWPVNFTDLNGEINGTAQFTDAYIDGLDDALKGFHPIEFLIWGENGNKTFDQFSAREKEYLAALGKNLKTLTAELAHEWNASVSTSYYNQFIAPAANNQFYETKKEVYQEIVSAMAGICEEVAGGKIGEPFTNQDPSLEESPYSKNSLKDFTNNMISVQNIYLGKFNTDGYGLEDIVRKQNLSLDNNIKAKMLAAIAALNNITVPFGQAISTQQTQVQNAINAIESLKEVLEVDLMNFVNQYIVD